MRLAAIKAGMKLEAVGDYADCIRAGDRFVVYDVDGALNISCRGSGGSAPGRCHHDLASSTDRRGHIPELMPAT